MGMFDSIKKVWSQDMANHLGTANTLFVVKGQAVVLKEPTELQRYGFRGSSGVIIIKLK